MAFLADVESTGLPMCLLAAPQAKPNTQIQVPAGLELLLRLDGVACFRTCTLAKEYTVPYRFYAVSTPNPGTCGIHFDFDTGDCIKYRQVPGRYCTGIRPVDT